MFVKNYKKGVTTFVMPHWRDENIVTKRYLDEALEGIFAQTDPNWQLVIIDDLSPCKTASLFLDELKAKHSNKIHIIKNKTNNGPGYCRNLGIKWAYEHQSPIVLFNDADDISDKRRLEIAREIFESDSQVSLVYSTFKVIDENSNIVAWSQLTQSIVEILEGHRDNPPQGINAWIEIGTEKGYTNLTSSTVVDTELAYKYPFPQEKVSEDSNTWMRYSAGGNKFVYCGEIPTLYRICQNTAGSASRSREGGRRQFYLAKARVDTDGFTRALEIALTNKKIKIDQRDELLIRFYLKLAETMYREQEVDITQLQINKAKLIDETLAIKIIREKGFQAWAGV